MDNSTADSNLESTAWGGMERRAGKSGARRIGITLNGEKAGARGCVHVPTDAKATTPIERPPESGKKPE